jgi:uncharacterized protein YbjT (DUF2867 family)
MQRRPVLFAAALLLVGGLRAEAQETKPIVLLGGATGKNGSVILKALQGGPYHVRAMTRDAEKANAKYGTIAEWVQADVTKPETLPPAMKDVSYVIDAVAATGIMGDNKPERVDFEGTRNLAAAAKAAGVKRFVIITSSVSGKKDHFLNKIGNDVLIYKGKAEEELIASGVPYVIIGPSGMNDKPGATQEIKLIPRAEYKDGMTITRADTALVAIEALTNPDAANKAFTVYNGEARASAAWKQTFAGLPAK